MSEQKLTRSPRTEIEVGQEQIDNSLKRSSSHCMIAEAIKATIPSAKYVSVDLQTIRYTDREKGIRLTYLTPRSCQVNLVKFDQGIPPEPFKFRLQGGQVTRSLQKENKTGPSTNSKPSLRTSRGGNARTVPERAGGVTPPLAHVRGTRRSFGIRGLDL